MNTPICSFPEGETIGFIAQELEEVIPHAVATTDQDFKAVNYELLVPVLVSAIQDQQKQIEQLEARISEMEGSNATGTFNWCSHAASAVEQCVSQRSNSEPICRTNHHWFRSSTKC
jgi:adenylosuccinate lyase